MLKTDVTGKLDYFIVCHDQDIIANKISKRLLPNCRFLFVGNGNIDRLKQYNTQVIICRNLANNIEDYPSLCSFTAWYSVIKNNLSISQDICLLEYDIDTFDNFHSSNLSYCPLNNSIVGYAHTLVHHYVFHKSTPWLEIALKKIHNIDLENLLDTQLKHSMYWPISTNILLSSKTLDSFVDWFLPMAQLFKNHPLGSYVHERALFIYCIINGVEIKYNLHCSHHEQLASHNNHDLYGAFLQRHNTRDFKEHMKMEYDQIYKRTLDSLL